MVLRAESVRVRLLHLEEVISQLTELASLDRGLLTTSLVHAWAVERGLSLAAEILFDIGNHILAAHFGVAARSYEDILDQLARHGVLDRDLRARLKGLGGFRNLLVHDYMRLEREKLIEPLLGASQDYGDFARAVRLWLAMELLPKEDGSGPEGSPPPPEG